MTRHASLLTFKKSEAFLMYNPGNPEELVKIEDAFLHARYKREGYAKADLARISNVLNRVMKKAGWTVAALNDHLRDHGIAYTDRQLQSILKRQCLHFIADPAIIKLLSDALGISIAELITPRIKARIPEMTRFRNTQTLLYHVTFRTETHEYAHLVVAVNEEAAASAMERYMAHRHKTGFIHAVKQYPLQDSAVISIMSNERELGPEEVWAARAKIEGEL